MTEAAPNGHLEVLTKFVAAREKHPRAAMFALQAVARELLGDSRMKICYRYRIPDRDVEIWHSRERKTAYYQGLMKCGLQWVCPLCSARISEKRRISLREALDNCRAEFVPVMASYTVQHNAGDRLASLLNGMLSAYRKMRGTRFWRTLKEEYMIFGECRALEITHGENGWHPHFHVLMFLRTEILPYMKNGNVYDLEGYLYEPLRIQLTSEWIGALGKHNLNAQDGPGLHVRGDFSTIDDYLTKMGTCLPKQIKRWGVAEELTKSNRKTALAGSVNVWDMLLLHYAGVPLYGALFVEYFRATSGKSGMQWTPGMLKALQVTQQSDDELLAADQEPGDTLLLALSSDQWRQVLDAGAAGALLDAAASGDYAQVDTFLGKLSKLTVSKVPELTH